MGEKETQDYLRKLEEHLKKGYGQGEGMDYKPLSTVFSFSSRGKSHIVFGATVPREYHLFSDLEDDFFNLVDFMDNVVDIREQYPLLPLGRTLEIAESLGLRRYHPQADGHPVVMQTDFLVTYIGRDGSRLQAVRTVKPSSELANRNVIAKFAIEQRFFQEAGIDDWKIVTELQMDPLLASNTASLRDFADPEGSVYFAGMTPKMVGVLSETLRGEILASARTVREECARFEREYGLEAGCGTALYKHLLARKRLIADLSDRFFGLDKIYRG